jgi:hypothetical protein
MPLPTAKAIDIVAFVPAESIDPVRIGDSYYLEADGQVSAKPYELLRQALERSGKAAPTGRASPLPTRATGGSWQPGRSPWTVSAA